MFMSLFTFRGKLHCKIFIIAHRCAYACVSVIICLPHPSPAHPLPPLPPLHTSGANVKTRNAGYTENTFVSSSLEISLQQHFWGGIYVDQIFLNTAWGLMEGLVFGKQI